jgi:hypothetical protein
MDRQDRCSNVCRQAIRASPALRATLALAVLVLPFGLLFACSTACATKETIPPTTPADLRYEILDNNNTIHFSWNPATDNGSGVEGYLAKTSWQGKMSEYWNYNGLNTDWYADAPRTTGTCTFMVKAVDKAGNEGLPASIQFWWNAT